MKKTLEHRHERKVCRNPDCLHGEAFEQIAVQEIFPIIAKKLRDISPEKQEKYRIDSTRMAYFCNNCRRIWNGFENGWGELVVTSISNLRLDLDARRAVYAPTVTRPTRPSMSEMSGNC